MKAAGPFRLAFLALIVGALLCQPQSAWAVIDYGSGSGTRVFTSPVPALANYEGTWGGFLGTPIASYYFISAKHINGVFGDGVGATFTINSTNFTVTAQYDSPSSDLTVWAVNPNSTAFSSGNIAPLYPLYSPINAGYENGKSLVVTGRGTDVGTQVLVGATLKGWQWGTSDGQQSWGTNTVSSIVNGGSGLGSLLRFTFDSSGGFNEGTLSVGDSAGGVFIQHPNDSTWKLAGINYGVDGPFSLSSDGSSNFNAAIFDRSGLYQYEGTWVAESGPASAYSTRIANNDIWINSITGSPIWKGAAGNGNWSTATNWSSTPANGNNLVFSGSAQTSNSNNSLTSVGTITFDGSAASFSLSGNALTISGGLTNFSSNSQTIGLNLTLSAAQQFNAVLGNLTVNGSVANGGNTLTVNSSTSKNVALAGVVSGTGALVKSGAGTLTVSNDNTYGGGTTVNAGTLTVGHVHALGSGGLTINSAAKATLQSNLGAPVQLPSLTIQGGTSPTGTLDITNDNLIVHNGNLATLTAQIKSGLNGPSVWTGTGITSSTAAAETVTAVGIISNDNGAGGALYSTWPVGADAGGAVAVTNTDVLIKYTYFGDANLDGVVDGSTDYSLWASGLTSGGSLGGWLYGDFNYNGVVDNSTDYSLWASGFTSGGGPLVGGDVQPVPEPSTLLLAAFGLVGLIASFGRRAKVGQAFQPDASA